MCASELITRSEISSEEEDICLRIETASVFHNVLGTKVNAVSGTKVLRRAL